jgi:hypothetical protein
MDQKPGRSPRIATLAAGGVSLAASATVKGLEMLGVHLPLWIAPFLVVAGIGGILVGSLIWLSSFLKDSADAVPATYMTPYEVVHYLSDQTRWGWAKRRETSASAIGPISYNPLLEAAPEFREKAMQEGSNIKVFGLLEGHGSVLIPHTFWMSNGFSYDACFDKTVRARSAPAVYDAVDHLIYYDLMVDRSGVIKTWPRMNLYMRMTEWRRKRSEAKAMQKLVRLVQPQDMDI